MMVPTTFAGDAADYFVASGWRQFFLNEHFMIAPPYNSLAELCEVRPERLKSIHFLNIFDSSSQETLQSRLSQLKMFPAQPIHSMVLTLEKTGRSQMSIELMLYPAPENSIQGCYVGFMRPAPGAIFDHWADRTTEQFNAKRTQFEGVAQLGRHIATILDLDTLLDYVVKSLNQDFGYQYVSVFFVDDDETTITLRALAGKPIASIDYLSMPIDNSTVIGHVAASGKPIRLDNNSPHQVDILDYLAIDAQSELAIPVVSGRQVLAILDIQSENPHGHQADDLVLMQTIANQLAVAIVNARLLEERDRRMAELSTFNQIGVALVGDRDLESTLSNILRRISSLLLVEAVSLMLLEEDGLHFAVAIGGGAEEIKSFVLRPGQGIAWSVVENRQTIRVDNVKTDARHFSDIDSALNFSTNSLLAVPVQIQDRILGVIEVMNRRDGRPFTRENETTLEFIASAIAVVLENGRLFDETQQQLNTLTIFTQASEAITKAPALNQLLEIVLDFAMSIIGADAGAIALSDELMPQTLRIAASSGYGTETIEQFNRLNILYDVGVFGESYRTREIVAVKDSASDPYFFGSAQIARVVPEAFTNVPLFSQDDFVGMIILHALPDDHTRAMLKAVADIAAVAIDKARLFGKTNQWLAEVLTLYTLSDQLTNVIDLSLNHIIESSVGILKHALDCSCCFFLNHHSENRELDLAHACSGRYESESGNLEAEFVSQLAKLLVVNPRLVYIEDVADPQLSVAFKSLFPELLPLLAKASDNNGIQIRSVMMAPLIVKEEVLGILSIDHKRPKAFGQSEERLLTIAAAQISTAIENVRLYNDLEQRAAELEDALRKVQEANRLKSEFVQNVSHELRTPLTFVVAYVELIREGSLGDVPPEMAEKLEIISQKTRAITRLVDDVISLQKIETGNLKFELIEPHKLISSATHGAIASAAEYDIEIVSSSPPDLPVIQVDVDRIGQVFDNLVGNAIKFSPTGGKINITAERHQEFVKFSVQDFGIGIPADKLNRVFERFYQVDGSTTRRYRGAGLGLAIVKQIIEAHNGRVMVESEVKKFTTFSFLLPVWEY